MIYFSNYPLESHASAFKEWLYIFAILSTMVLNHYTFLHYETIYTLIYASYKESDWPRYPPSQI